ncbi:hypothetical protein GCG21_08640 [Pseudactinotalea sp. HY160]|uniref:hypothetical protein n=1 Tax=Pseudactinotalea sp. HY160 TaxID=2654490 RepID=UPI00128D1804|nr:hypothetical protein [Pseudactinotalea sp. HY160]MPV50071.1 hypothetical protein [Pseudactinotalea sp. HY160]
MSIDTTSFASTIATIQDRYHAQSLARAKNAFAGHEMRVLHSDGVYRHLRFATPGTGMFRFDIHTAPGLLTLTGDIGTFVFSRVRDMLSFFHDPTDTNVTYWAQKLLAPSGLQVNEYDEHVLRASLATLVDELTEHWTGESRAGLTGALELDVWGADDSHDLTVRALMEFQWTDPVTGETIEFPDAYELPMRSYGTQFLLACHGLRAASLHYVATVGGVDFSG